MADLLRAMAMVGTVLVVTGVVLVLMAWDGLDQRLPLQVPPRRLARYPLVAGAMLLALAGAGYLFP